jgi:outer membrane receptor protein involved in Fe transport
MRNFKTILAAITLIGFSFSSQAQDKNGKISGIILDYSGKQVEAASVSLLNAKDSSLVKIGAADKQGLFSFESLPEGNYLVTASAVGFGKKYSEVLEISASKKEVTLKSLALDPKSTALGNVTVTAKKPLVEQKIDRTVVNVEAAVTNAGASALEILEKSPGITVDKDGNISLKGKQGVMVLVDGRPTQLGSADLANLLRSMNASQLDQIEIMTNPPAKYDAAGNAGIINIKTKKTKAFGYNGSITLGYSQGKYPKFNEGINFNYREGKVNVFANLSHNYRKGFQRLDINRNTRDFSTKEITSYILQDAHMQNINNSVNAKLGLDYAPNKNTTYGIVLGGFTNPGDFSNTNYSNGFDRSGNLRYRTISESASENRFKNFSTNLNFRKTYKAGKELTADLDYITYSSQEGQSLFADYYNNIGMKIKKSDTLYSTLPQDIHIYSGRLDYLQPFKNGGRFEAGLKTSYVSTDNNARFDTTDNGKIVTDRNRSNHFVYDENINAAYVNYSRPLGKKWNTQLGLRLEHTQSLGNQKTTKVETDTSYAQLFPTAFIQYKASEKNVFGVNYGRRIRRPNYESLNPFIEYLDPFTFQMGNPYLKPQISNNVELSHTFKNFLTTTLNYTNTKDILQQYIEQKGDTAYMKQDNIAKQQQFGIAVSANMPITKWWTSSLYVNASHNRFEGVVDNTPVVVKAKMVMLNGSQQFKFAKTWGAEVSGFYRTKGVEGIILTQPVGVLNLGVSKQIMKNKATVRLNVRDILYTQKFRAETKYANVDAGFKEWRDSRVVNVGFTYRFTKGKMNGSQKRRTGSANDEQSRVGGGSGN